MNGTSGEVGLSSTYRNISSKVRETVTKPFKHFSVNSRYNRKYIPQFKILQNLQQSISFIIWFHWQRLRRFIMYLCTFVLTINFFFIALKKFRENNDFTKEVNKEMIPRSEIKTLISRNFCDKMHYDKMFVPRNCGNCGILLPRFCRKNSVKLISN